ncbi:MFS general substrate transporter [Macrolepiota fuliginosa MF-IS2]|uniref:MFS general substrate transporter n=1 Tax=Macrolepiota fuliginosa MF-IS2 TaxID=1400762 RepID=A0A9P5XIW4_9AGAR|nr:MFS general substrate transporter [Macrolepiota fuliginosa MF-IS2]
MATYVSSPQDGSRHTQMTKKILWKLDCRILPPLALLWLANFIDRSNIGNAKIAGLERDARLHGDQFNSVLAELPGSYLIVEVPSNIVMKKFKPNRWLAILVCLWGVVTTLTSVVHNFGGLLAIRICLGLCEGGLLPGMILYLSTIYKRHELQLRVGIFYASASLSGAFGGLLASAIIQMDGVGGLSGWRWIFILEGIATVLIGIIAACILPADLASAPFLTQEERDFAVRRFQEDGKTAEIISGDDDSPMEDKAEKGSQAHHESAQPVILLETQKEDERFEWREVVRGCLDIQVWLTGLAYWGAIVSLYSYSLFLPTIIAGLGYSGVQAQLRTVPPYVPAAVLTVIVAYLSDRLRWRGPFILICLPLSIIGYIIAVTATNDKTRYIAVFFMAAGIYPAGPCLLSILPNNSRGHYKKATTTALQLAVANTGGFLATFVYTPDQAPKYHKGHTIVLACVILAWVMIAANVLYCLWENKARREGRRQGNIDKYLQLVREGKTRAPIGDRHPEFMFTL